MGERDPQTPRDKTTRQHPTPKLRLNPTNQPTPHNLYSSITQKPFQGFFLPLTTHHSHLRSNSPPSSITTPILPPRPPPLLPPPAVKLGLPQLPIHLVVRLAQPGPERVPALRPHLPLLHVPLEVLGAHPARVELGEEAHEAREVGLLPGRRRGRVGRGDRVEQRPRAAPEGLDVRGAVFGLRRWCGGGFEGGFGLRGPRGEGGAGAAAGGRRGRVSEVR